MMKLLRKVESEVCIPGIIRECVRREKCHYFIHSEMNRKRKKKFLLLI
jgi:hypothetical protein